MSDAGETRPGALRARLAALTGPRRAEALLAHVQARAAALLGLSEPAAVGPDAPWIGLGFDSLRAVDLRSGLAHDLDLPLRSTLLFDHPQPRALVAHLLAMLTPADEPAALPAAATPSPPGEPVAIVGAACRFPGADDLEQFGQLLADGRDAVAPIPADRFDVDALFDPDPAAAGKLYVRDAALLHGIDRFDAAFFGISPREAVALDPQQRLLLEVGWHALEHANLPPRALAGHRVGVYVGIRAGEYFDSQTARTPVDADAYYHTGNQLSTAAGRLAYTFGFRGPCFAIDTACSASLVALHVAVRALRAGECDVAVVGGVNVVLDPVAMAALCRARMLSPDGRCKAFDAAADGYGRGEGCGVVVLRRLGDAEAAGDRVLAVVAGTAINQDGRSSGLTVPHGPAQVEVVREALANAGVAAAAIDFVEAHGTGTALGDPIEVAALDEVFAGRTAPLPIGSVKTQIGHLEAAAGIAGLLKVVLALRSRTLPASLHFRTPNPHVDWARSVVRVAATTTALRRDGDLHAGVSSFGFSGTNCHVVVRSAPPALPANAPTPAGRPCLLALQAADRDALRALAARHADTLTAGNGDLAAWCHAAAVGRQPLPARAAFVAASPGQLVAALRAFAAGDDGAASATGGGTTPVQAVAARPGDGPPATEPLLALAGQWAHGLATDLAAVHGVPGPPRAELPAYPFQRHRFWHERRATPPPPAGHPLLGERRESSLLAPGQLLFANTLAADRPVWLGDHRANGRVLFPLAGMLEVALAAELAAGTPLPIALRDAAVRAARPLTDEPAALEFVRTASATGAMFVWKGRHDDGSWRTHLDGAVAAADAPAAAVDLGALRARCPRELPATALYERCTQLGLQYGPCFRGVRRLWCGDGEALAEVDLPAGLAPGPMVLHPALLDACLQAVVAALPADVPPFLPVAVAGFVVHRRGGRRLWSHARQRGGDAAKRFADYTLCDDDGNLVATVTGLLLVPAKRNARRGGLASELLHHVAWAPSPAAATSPLPARIGLVGWPDLADALRAQLPPGAVHATTPDALPALLAAQRLDVLLLLGAPPPPDSEPMAAQQRLLGAALATVQQALRAAHPVRLGLVTHGAQAAGPAPAGPVPHASALLGLWRTLALEQPSARPFAVDLDPVVPATAVAEHAAVVLTELRRSDDEPEVAWRHGERLARRLRRGPTAADPLTLPAAPFRLRTRQYGSFDALTAVPLARRSPGRDEVEVAFTAAALNFKDVLHVRGLLRDVAAAQGVHDAADQPLGFEGTGVITAVGTEIRHLAVGDRIAVLGPDCLASHATVPADHVFPLPDGVDPRTVAGAPVVFATVLHALVDLARVQRGEAVLVHAAAGGVGQAAIRLLQHLGCRVLATASRGKQALVRALGAAVVGDSRTPDFTPAVLAATGGRGVDVVLNTLNGTSVPQSLASLARGGRFVELGKLGVWTAAQVGAARPDVRHFAFDLGDAFAADPQLRPRLLGRLHELLRTVQLPVPTILPLAHVRSACRHLAQGHSVGKVVLTLPAAAPLAGRTWLLTGAAGGLAPAIATALVDAGARHLALLARGAIPATLLASLQARGVQVLPLTADVADRESLAAALVALRTALPPLGGIVHAAGALADATIPSLDWQRAAAALRAKVAGTVWLDELTAGDELAAFVLVASMAGTLGNPGQAAYSAANAFLDGFAAWRRARGRPATSLAFGPWDGPGMTGRLDDAQLARLRQRGITRLSPDAAARFLVEHRADAGDVAVLPVQWAEWLAPFGGQVPRTLRELRPEVLRPATTNATVDLAALPPAGRAAVLRALVAEQVARAFGFTDPGPLLAGRSFRDLGLDSLLAMEAKERLEQVVGRELPATLLFDQPDLQRLVGFLLAGAPTRA